MGNSTTFKPGNDFWKRRTKFDQNALFTDPTELLNACEEYFEYTSSRAWVKEDWVGKDAKKVERKTQPPFTISGLCTFLGVSEAWWRQFKSSKTYQENTAFSTVFAHVEQIIYTQKFEGAAVGAYHWAIIARDIGLKEPSDPKKDELPPNTTIEVTLNIG